MLVMTMTRLQMNLVFLGYDTGGIDGIKGAKTKNAIRQYRISRGLGDSEIADQKMIDCIRNEICEIQRTIGATVDGVAGNETITKKAEYDKKGTSYSWDNVKHFKKSEFTCKCGCGFNNIDLNLVKILDEIREHYNKPLVITSGCRCQTHNANVGGVKGSRHVLGKASDIYVQGVSTKDLLNYTTSLVNAGKLRYTYTNNANMSGAVHVDIV